MADELKACRACENDCRVERFEGHAIEGVMTIYMCANSTKFGGDCPDLHAYLNVNAWNHRIEPEAADRGVSEALDRLAAMSDEDAGMVHYMLLERRRADPALDAQCRRVFAMLDQSLRSEQEGGHD